MLDWLGYILFSNVNGGYLHFIGARTTPILFQLFMMDYFFLLYDDSTLF